MPAAAATPPLSLRPPPTRSTHEPAPVPHDETADHDEADNYSKQEPQT
jgi:hypothetical protein